MILKSFPLASCQAIFTLIAICPFTSSEKVILDSRHSLSQQWFDISCVYMDDASDFWVHGCPVDLPGAGSDGLLGFWSPCNYQQRQCEIHYFGGVGVPQPKSIRLNFYVGGSAEIVITSKGSMAEREYSNKIVHMSYKDARGWFETDIDMTEHSNAIVTNFTLTSSPGDILLLDKIIVDLEDGVTFPPEPTTPAPIIDDWIVLDKDSDYWVVWNQTQCNYVRDSTYLWAFGCVDNPRVEVGREDGGTGYWGPCAVPTCKLQYMVHPLVPQPKPITIIVKGYLEGSARIEVVLQPDPLDHDCIDCIPIGTVHTPEGGGWMESTFEVEEIVSEDFRINFNLVQEAGGTVVLERIKLKLQAS